ncbi:MAG: hypothetical protein JO153_09545 [Solirubrobacterales bacterium]|nr:hypothetical protein [Solirubrobacterales bacterium]
MSLGRYVLGAVLCAICLGAVLLGSRALRERLLPGWEGAPAWVADTIIGAGLLVVVLQLIGIVGLFDLPAAVVACVGGGAILWAAGGRTRSDRAEAPTQMFRGAAGILRAPARVGRGETIVAAIAIGAVAAPWLSWTIFSYRHGMQTPDTLWYHLPQAARFVQAGNILHLQYFDSDPVTVFYPANAELFHALGLLLFGTDLLSPAINLGWATLALLAAWAVGRPFGRGPHCLIAVLLLLATPALIDTQPGGAYNDVACIALVLSAGALLVNGGLTPAPSAIAAVAAGLALGTKFTMIPAVLALGAGVVVVTPRGARLRQAVTWVIALVALGAFWYVRDAVATGTPLPAISIHLGPLSLSAPHVTEPTFTVGQYLTNGHVWSTFYFPGLHQAFGPAWWAIVGFSALGALGAALARIEPIARMLGVVAVLCAGVYLVTPQFLGAPGAPIFFVYNLRYAAAPIVLGLVLIPLLPALRGTAAGNAWLGLAAVVLLVTELDGGVWPTKLGRPFSPPIHGRPAVAGALLGLLIVAGGLGWRYIKPRAQLLLTRGRLVVSSLSFAVAGVLAVCGWAVADSYARDRYAATSPIPRIFKWARDTHHTRIGIVGIVAQYPLYGPDGSNYVQYIGRGAAHGGFGSITTCRGWREVIDRGHYSWLVIAPTAFPLTNQRAPELAWTGAASGATPVILERAVSGPPNDVAELLKVTGSLDPNTC